jgi:ribosomal protein S12 methylthiotransferase accessory factor
LRLRDTVAKSGGPGTSREVTAADTYRRVRPHLRRIGVTRVADITGLDRVGIPVFNAICPRSRDTVSVYSGKGVTPTAARTSAVMEAVERYHAARPRLPDVVASYHELFTRQRRAIAPADFLLPCAP